MRLVGPGFVVSVVVVVVVVVVALKQNNYDILADSFSRISGCKTGLAQMEQNYFMRNQIILHFFIRVNWLTRDNLRFD